MDFEVPQITRKLGLISEVMADGYHFIMLRQHIEQWDRDANEGNVQAQEMIRVIETFHRLCLTIKEM